LSFREKRAIFAIFYTKFTKTGAAALAAATAAAD
jgi:hypothetical protein